MERSLLIHEPFNPIAAAHGFDDLFFVHQVHGTDGVIVASDDVTMPRSFTRDADWIVSNKPGLGIGILIADCVPLLLYDPVTRAVGAVHAGWRGATSGVISAALNTLRSTFGTQMANLQVFIGSHAKNCCYQVDQPFYDTVMKKSFGSSAWHHRDDKLFFDLYQCCLEQLRIYGISENQITLSASCTICDTSYSSYRREREAAGRNIAVIGLINR